MKFISEWIKTSGAILDTFYLSNVVIHLNYSDWQSLREVEELMVGDDTKVIDTGKGLLHVRIRRKTDQAAMGEVKYPSKQAVEAELRRRESEELDNNTAALAKSKAEGGDKTLYRAAVRFGVEIPTATKYQYPSKEAVEVELRRREGAGLENNVGTLKKSKTKGGDRSLYRAALKFGVKLQRKRGEGYKSKEDVEAELRRREGEGLENNASTLYKSKAEDGDYTLYIAAVQFGVKLPRKRSEGYKSKEAVEAELRRREGEGLENNVGILYKSKEGGGDLTLYRAAVKFGVELPKKKVGMMAFDPSENESGPTKFRINLHPDKKKELKAVLGLTDEELTRAINLYPKLTQGSMAPKLKILRKLDIEKENELRILYQLYMYNTEIIKIVVQRVLRTGKTFDDLSKIAIIISRLREILKKRGMPTAVKILPDRNQFNQQVLPILDEIIKDLFSPQDDQAAMEDDTEEDDQAAMGDQDSDAAMVGDELGKHLIQEFLEGRKTLTDGKETYFFIPTQVYDERSDHWFVSLFLKRDSDGTTSSLPAFFF